MQELSVGEVAEVSGGLWPLIYLLVVVDAFIWGAVAGKDM